MSAYQMHNNKTQGYGRIVMKKIIIPSIVLLFACSCSSYKIANSMWYNVTPSELQGAKGEVVNGLYFYEDGNVSMKTAVVSDTTIIAKPILTGWGTYSHSGTIKKGIRLKINTAFKLDEKAVDYDGIITKNGMLLYASDSTALVFQRAIKNK